MARFVTGNDFNTGDQVTATTLNNAVNNAKASTDSVDNSSIAVDGSGVLSVKTSTSASDGVTFAKFQQIPANTVLVRDANSLGSVSAKAVTDTQILIGDGTGFTSAALSGDVTMTNAGVVTIANDAVETAMIADDVALGGNPTTTTQSAGNNTTRIATTEFVTTAVNNGLQVATYRLAGGSASSNITVQLTEQADPSNFASVSSGVISIPTGLYLIRFFGYYELSQGSFDIDYKINDSVVAAQGVASNTDEFNFVFDYIHSNSSGTDTIKIDLEEKVDFSNITFQNVGVTVMKLPS